MSCQFRILDYNYVFQPEVVLTPSSIDNEFPVSNLKKPFRSATWRSGGNFVVTTANQKIDFKEGSGGSELTATITPDTYSVAELETEITTQLAAAGTKTYDVSFSGQTGLWTILTSDGTFLSLTWQSGSHSANSIGATLGFDISADDTGALTYTGANIALHTEESVVIDILTTDAIDSFAMVFEPTVGSKFSDSASVRLQANASNSWGSPALDIALSVDEVYGQITYFFANPQSYRYWRVKIVDPSNAFLYVEIPKLILSLATQLSQLPSSGFEDDTADPTKISSTPYGHEYGDLYPLRRTISYTFNLITESDEEAYYKIFIRNGKTTPIAIALDPLSESYDKDRFFLYGRILNDFKSKQNVFTYFDSSLAIKEAI